MKHYHEMPTKYGFNDSEAIPTEACAARYVYVQAMNFLLGKHGFGVRLVAYDRPGWFKEPLTDGTGRVRLLMSKVLTAGSAVTAAVGAGGVDRFGWRRMSRVNCHMRIVGPGIFPTEMA